MTKEEIKTLKEAVVKLTIEVTDLEIRLENEKDSSLFWYEKYQELKKLEPKVIGETEKD